MINDLPTHSVIPSKKGNCSGEKLAKFGICGQIFDEICTFWWTKNGIFGGKILWSL